MAAVNPSTFSWTIPTLNTNGSAILAGEITGFSIGIRSSTGTAGTYPTLIAVASPTATTAPMIATPLEPGAYAAAIQTVGPADSAWSAEVAFTITAAPQPPSAFGVA
jgi:hypothetical protein